MKLKYQPGVVVADNGGNYLSLVKPTATGWTVQNISSREKKDLELVRHEVRQHAGGGDPRGHHGRQQQSRGLHGQGILCHQGDLYQATHINIT